MGGSWNKKLAVRSYWRANQAAGADFSMAFGWFPQYFQGKGQSGSGLAPG
jgi:hypothetical protein